MHLSINGIDCFGKPKDKVYTEIRKDRDRDYDEPRKSIEKFTQIPCILVFVFYKAFFTMVLVSPMRSQESYEDNLANAKEIFENKNKMSDLERMLVQMKK